MSKIKKLLALTLALAMILSVSAFAGYTVAPYGDADKVDEDCEVAVQLLYSMNIMKGDNQGNFNPTATITRAEIAKMIYVILNYGKDDKAVNYTGGKLFSDVPAGAWYEGYVNYCATTKLVQGRGNGTFGPNDPVTTAEAAKMLLTAIGYSAEARGYVGAGWDKQVLSDASVIGLLDGYNYPTTTYAPRQWVAVMFMNALTDAYTYGTITPVIFNGLLTGTTLPTDNYKTMGEKYYNMASFEGAITANEYADLYSAYHKSAGKTTIDDELTLNFSTDLTEIGESRWGYYNTKTKEVYYVADTGDNTVYSTGDAKDISSSSKFKSVTGIKYSSDIEYFENFAYASSSKYVCDYRLAYGDPADLKVINKNTTFGQDVMDVIEAIFNSDDDDYAGHVVYVGTQRDEDVSDKMSFKQFKNTYIEASTKLETSVTANENGNWLRVVDNNGDGYADYVFHTVFTMAEVESIAKNGTLTLTGSVYSGKYYVSSEELAEGDIVLHTYIDDEDYIKLAPTFTGKVDKYTYRTDVLTVEGEDYVESDINEYTGYYNELEDAKKNREYTYYLDFFNHIRVFNLPNGDDGELVLLTDAYYETNRSGDVYAAYAYLNGEVTDYDVYAPYTEVDLFIRNDKSDSSNAWDRLIVKEGTTNLARYTEEDNTLSLWDAKTYTYGKKNEKTNIKTDYINLDNVDVESGQTWYKGRYIMDADDAAAGFKADCSDREITVQANKNTVFYYVTRTASGKAVVNSVVGYKNSIDVIDSIVGIEAMYAVATNTWSDSANRYYWVADAIVVETDVPVFNLNSDVVLGYDVVNKTVNDYAALDVVDNTAALDTLNVINKDGDSFNDFKENKIAVPEFYFNTEDENEDSYIIQINKDFADYGIYVGTVDRVNALFDYVVAVGGKQLDYDDETVVYDLYGNDRITSVDDDDDPLTLETGCEYIFYAPKGDVVYAILVDATYTDDNGKVIVDNGRALFDKIYADANPAPVVTELAKVMAELAKYDTEVKADQIAAAEEAVAAAKAIDPATITAKEGAELKAAYEHVEALIAAAKEALADAEALAAVQAAYDEIIDEIAAMNAGTDSAWPAGATDAAKAAVAEALAEMTADEIAALKPATGDDIWNDVIVPVVGEMQQAFADAELKAKRQAIVDGYVTKLNAEKVSVYVSILSLQDLEDAIKNEVAYISECDEYTEIDVELPDYSLSIGKGTIPAVKVTFTRSGATATATIDVEVNTVIIY